MKTTTGKAKSQKLGRQSNRRSSAARTSSARQGMEMEVARRLAIAWVSYVSLVSYQTAMKRYGTQPPGDYWLSLARKVLADHTGQRLAPVLKLVPKSSHH